MRQAYEQAQRDIEDKQYATWAREQGIPNINSKQDYELWEQSQQQNVPYELMQEIAGMKQMMQQTLAEKQRLEYESTIKAQEQALANDGDYGDLFKANEQGIRQIAYSAGVDLNTALAVFLMQDQGRQYFRQFKGKGIRKNGGILPRPFFFKQMPIVRKKFMERIQKVLSSI